MDQNIVWHKPSLTKAERRVKMRHHSFVVWFTGLSGSGKSTVANALEAALFERGLHTYLLDGDNVRHGLNKDLGFGDADRQENIRRIGETAKLFVDAGVIVLTAFISPFRIDRQIGRDLLEIGEFIEVFIKCPLSECERRDPKGLYRKARKGELKNFTGIDSAYEEPISPEITLETDHFSPDACVEKIIAYLTEKKLI